MISPVLLSLFGLWLDRRLGTGPWLMFVLLAFGAVGAVVKVYYDFRRAMAAAVADRDAAEAHRRRVRALTDSVGVDGRGVAAPGTMS